MVTKKCSGGFRRKLLRQSGHIAVTIIVTANIAVTIIGNGCENSTDALEEKLVKNRSKGIEGRAEGFKRVEYEYQYEVQSD